MLLFLHLLFYYFLMYNIYIFILLNIFYFAIYSVNKFIKNKNIKTSNNIFIKMFISNNMPKTNYLYYLDIELSKYKLYEQYKDNYNYIYNQFIEFCDFVALAMEQNTKEFVFTSIPPTPLNLIKIIPMLLSQKYNRPIQPINPLLYDSDNDDLSVD